MATEQAALSLYQLLGAPLHALIEAETYAANATAAFIEQVGFESAEPPSANAGDIQTPRGHLGKLRTLSFHQERRIGDGSAATYKVEVPLLSIVPIPALQIKEAELEFFAKVVDIVALRSPRQPTTSDPGHPTGEQANDVGLVSKQLPETQHLDMKALLGRGQPNAPTVPQSAFDMQVHIKIKVAQADPPAGLSRLFNLMEQSISSTRVP